MPNIFSNTYHGTTYYMMRYQSSIAIHSFLNEQNKIITQEMQWTIKDNKLFNLEYVLSTIDPINTAPTITIWYLKNNSLELTRDPSQAATINLTAYSIIDTVHNQELIINFTQEFMGGSINNIMIKNIALQWIPHPSTDPHWTGWTIASQNIDPVFSMPWNTGLYQLSSGGKCLRNDLTWGDCNHPDNPTSQWRYHDQQHSLSINQDLYQGSKKFLYQSLAPIEMANTLNASTTSTISPATPSVLDATTVAPPRLVAQSLLVPSEALQGDPPINSCVPYEICDPVVLSASEVPNFTSFELGLANGWPSLYNKSLGMCYDQSLNPVPCSKFNQCALKTPPSHYLCTPDHFTPAWTFNSLYQQQANNNEKMAYPPVPGGDPQTQVFNLPSKCEFANATERILDQNFKPVPSTPPFDITEMDRCCQGLHMVQKAVPVAGIRLHRLDNDSNLVCDWFPWTPDYANYYYLDDPDQIPRKFSFISEVPNSQTILKISPFLSLVTSLIASEGFIQLYAMKPVLDGRCSIDWCPWSLTCANQTGTIKNYCSTIDEQGHPRLNTDLNCRSWCTSLNEKGSCGDAAVAFCNAYPTHYACTCQNIKDTPYYNKMIEIFKELPGNFAIPGKPLCWAAPCSQQSEGPEAMLLSTDLRNYICDTQVNICSQFIEYLGNAQNVTINNNKMSQVCGTNATSAGTSALKCNYVFTNWSTCANGLQTRSGILAPDPTNNPSCTPNTTQTQKCTVIINPDNGPGSPKIVPDNPTNPYAPDTPPATIDPTNPNTLPSICQYDHTVPWSSCSLFQQTQVQPLLSAKDSTTTTSGCNPTQTVKRFCFDLKDGPTKGIFIGVMIFLGILLIFLSIMWFKHQKNTN